MNTPNMKSAIAGFAGLPSFKRNGRRNGDLRDSPRKSVGDELSSEMILENLPAYISSLDRMGVWRPLTHGNCEYFKSIESENFVQWVNEVVHVQDRVAVLKAVSDCRADDQLTIADFRLLNNSQELRAPQWVEIRCTPLPSQQTILTILRDISDRKKLENRILESRDSADEANAAKTRFLANMSHELRTPLNAIIGFSEILKSGMVPVSEIEKQQEYQGLINDSAQHLLNVLNDILDMSKIEAGKYDIYPEDIDLTQIIESCCSMLMPLANKAGVKLRVAGSREPLRFEADSKAIRQILINLVSNAIKFTRTDTTVDISAIRIGRKIEIKISDQGHGISPKCLDGLGEPFYQVDGDKTRQHEGTGLGLSIVKGLVQLHGGDFDIESKVGVGTTVTIRLAQSLGTSHPVPADDVDTIIRINPHPSGSGKKQPALSRLVG